MEAVAAIGLIGSIIQFVDLGFKVIKTANEIQQSICGLTKENMSLGEVTRAMHDLTVKLTAPTTKAQTADERTLYNLAQECRSLSELILNNIERSSLGNLRSKLRLFHATTRSLKYKEERKELEERLSKCRAQLHVQLTNVSK
ncbi:hypothetical protein N0V83_001653 [Neocucurbitaria cava]|uniref:Fungal N-terminal domain-containing protein n=1 Tax=Neocucurbitaria cava TaxID=798079 RepID=A0A9W8YG39_9PLEO|nr:hypothetical protein N0V83_001653 [Neocucurbitaria cava]